MSVLYHLVITDIIGEINITGLPSYIIFDCTKSSGYIILLATQFGEIKETFPRFILSLL